MCRNCEVPSLSRRSILTGAAVLAAAAALPVSSLMTSPAAAQDAVPPADALKMLEEGNARYVANTAINRDFSVGRAERAKSQSPFASIVSCADSRIAPELVFDQGPGDLFVVRVAGNFVNEDGLASLEFGSAVLGSQLIMVLGHTACGAIRATIDVVENGTELPGHLPALADAIKPAVEAAKAAKAEDLMAAATIENVRLNVAYLKTAAPILSDLVSQGKLDVVGGVYDLATGKVGLV
ncbi:MAG: carbonic anhydrase [Bauldia sp.]|nr:carbonic anhydrase [Bauldia sp.]